MKTEISTARIGHRAVKDRCWLLAIYLWPYIWSKSIFDINFINDNKFNIADAKTI